MIVLIALVTGITDVAALIAIAFVNASMILFGWIMEMVNEPRRGDRWWTPFWFGCIAGIGPWVAIVAYLFINVPIDGATPPTFVYGIIVTIFVLLQLLRDQPVAAVPADRQVGATTCSARRSTSCSASWRRVPSPGRSSPTR